MTAIESNATLPPLILSMQINIQNKGDGRIDTAVRKTEREGILVCNSVKSTAEVDMVDGGVGGEVKKSTLYFW